MSRAAVEPAGRGDLHLAIKLTRNPGDLLIPSIEDVLASDPLPAAALAALVFPGVLKSTLSIAALSAVKSEGASGSTPFTFTVTRAGNLDQVATVSWHVPGGGIGASPSDFAGAVLPSGVVSFAVGQTTQIITILVTGDTAIESDETFQVILSAPSANAVVLQASASGTIINDDSLAHLAITATDAHHAEGDSGSTPFTFTITRSGDLGRTEQANWKVASGGIGTSPSDFAGAIAPSGSVTFAPGETSKLITIWVAGDLSIEGDEMFQVILTSASPTANVIQGGSAAGVIVNDDEVAQLAIAATDAHHAEGDSGSTPFTFTITRSGDLKRTEQANWKVASGGIGTSPSDFAGAVVPSGSVTFAPGETSKVITILVAGDKLIESDEMFQVILTSASPTAVVIQGGSAAGVIVNDDDYSHLAITATDAHHAEGDAGSSPFTFTVTRTGDLDRTDTATWQVLGGAPDATGSDFVGGALPSGTISFAPGETSKVISLLVAGDKLIEPDEKFGVKISAASPSIIVSQSTAIGTIINDDDYSHLAITATDAHHAEGDAGSSPFTFTVTRTGDLDRTDTATWQVLGGAPDATGSDFVGGALPSGTISFAPGETSKVISLLVAGDKLIEPDEKFGVKISAASPSIIVSQSTAIGTIINDDDYSHLAITATDAHHAEGDAGSSPFTFTVTRTGDLDRTDTATWQVLGGAPDATGSDFVGGVLPSGTISFAPGETSKVITILVAGDFKIEGDEKFGVKISASSSSVIVTQSTAIGTIVNDDTPSYLAIASTSAHKAEGDSGSTPFTFTVTRTGDLDRTDTAAWKVLGGAPGATAGDFAGGVLPSGVVSFAPGETSQVITVLVAGDTKFEQDEGFGVLLSAPSTGVVISVSTAVGAILNDDVATYVGFDAGVVLSKKEGTGGATPFSFTVHRSGGLGGTDTVDWAVGNAPPHSVNGNDFVGGVLPSGTVSFAPGETAKVITVLVVGDFAIETDENFAVSLSNPSPGVNLTSSLASGIVLNDDAKSQIGFTPGQILEKPEGTGGTTPFTFTLQRTGDTDRTDSASWQVTIGSPNSANAADFAGGVLPSGTVTFAPGQTTQTLTVQIAADFIVETTETFGVLLSNPSVSVDLVFVSAFGLIDNDDIQTNVYFTQGIVTQAEGSGGTTPFLFTVNRSGDNNRTDTVDWAMSNGGQNAADAADFKGGALPSGTVTFLPGQTTQTIAIDVNGDYAVEPDENFTLLLSNPSPGVQLSFIVASGVIVNDDVQTQIYFTQGIVTHNEGNAGTTPYTFTVNRSGDNHRTDTVDWTMSNGGQNAADAADFPGGVFPSGTVTFQPGQTTQTITVDVAGDIFQEQDENFTLLLSNPSAGVSLYFIVASGIILNDDAQTSIQFTYPQPVLAEGNSGATPFTFNLARHGDIDRTDTADWHVAAGDPNNPTDASAQDFVGGVLPSGTVTFAPGQTTQAITVQVAGDTGIEQDENFFVTLTNPSVGVQLELFSSFGTILNDDKPSVLAITATDAQKPEGDAGPTPFTFTVSRTGDLAGASAASWQVTSGGLNSADAADFVGGVLPTGIVYFAPGQASQTITVAVNGDIAVEQDESFLVNIFAPSVGTTISQFLAPGVILNDDRPATISIAALRARQPEGDAGSTPFTFTVSRTGETGTAVSVDWSVAGAAVNGADGGDFTGGALPGGTIKFASGQVSQVLTVDVSGDLVAEADEGFTVTLSQPSDGAAIGAGTAAALILNDDQGRIAPSALTLGLDDAAPSFLAATSIRAPDAILLTAPWPGDADIAPAFAPPAVIASSPGGPPPAAGPGSGLAIAAVEDPMAILAGGARALM